MAHSGQWRFSLGTLTSAVVLVGVASALGVQVLAGHGLLFPPLPVWFAIFTVVGLLGLAVMMNSWD